MNLTDAIRFARMLGCLVEPPDGTGEVRFSHPEMPLPVKQHFERSATRCVVVWLRRLEDRLSLA